MSFFWLKLHILEWLLTVTDRGHTCVIIVLFNQHLYMPPVRWMDYLGKVEVLTHTVFNTFVGKI